MLWEIPILNRLARVGLVEKLKSEPRFRMLINLLKTNYLDRMNK